MLTEYLQKQMRRRNIGSKRLADLVNAQFDDLYLHRNTIENWRTGTVRRVRDWRPLLGIAAVLHLSADETNTLLTAATHPSLDELRVLDGDSPYLDYWKMSAPSTPNTATPAPATYVFNTPFVTLTLDDGTCITLHGAETFGIGRTDAARNWYPAVKLEDHNGIAAGVSRKHGAITITEDAVFLEDYGSRNGTQRNGEQLTFHRRYQLEDGDRLLFSRLGATVRIER